MHPITSVRGRFRALAPAAALLLALCLLAVGAQALTDPAATAAPVVPGPGLLEPDHDLELQSGTPTPSVTDGPAPYRLLMIPGRIQAEDYDFYIFGGEGVTYHDTTPGNSGGAYRRDDVDIETGNGITNIGWIRDGEYLTYTVDVAQTGDYYLALRVATPNSGCGVEVAVDGGRDMWVFVPKTGSFTTYTNATDWGTFDSPFPTVTRTPTPQATGLGPGKYPVRLSAGMHTLKVVFQGDGQNLDWIEFTPVPEPTPRPTSAPYRPLAIPGTIQAEDYDLGGEGVTYHDTTPANEGGAYRHDAVDIETAGGITDVGWIRDGEWLSYTVNVAQAGSYLMTAQAASPNSERMVTLWVDGYQMLTLTVPDTGSFDTFGPAIVPINCEADSCYPVPITLAAGTHTLKLLFSGDGQNLDWIAFDPVGATPTPDPTPSPYVNVTIPGTIEAENYDHGGEGVAYHDTTAGGHAVVGIEDGEWLNYSVNTTTPPAGGYPYPVEFWVASDREGRSVQVEVDGTVVRNVSVPNTGSLQAFEPVQVQFGYPLSQPGDHTIRLVFRGDGQALDRVVLRETRLFALADAYTRPNFTATPTNGTTPLTVRFTDTSSDFAYDWHWDFGDGATAGEKNPVHTFQRPGVYSVNLTIREEDHWGWDPAINGTVTGWAHFWYYPDYPFSTKTVQVTVGGTGPGTGHAIPGTIQAEDYDTGGEGVAYHDTTPGNSGGAYRQDDVDIETAGGITNVGWIRSGEWLSYTATVQSAGNYTMTASVASPNRDRTIAVSVDGAPAVTIAVPTTGSFATFRTVSVPVTLAAGTHILKLTFQGDGQNIDWIAFAPVGVTTPPTTPVPSGGASFAAVPVTAPHGSAVKFTVTPASGKSISAAWWSFDATAHLNTWNSRAVNPTFYYPSAGTYTPLVKLTYTDGSSETVQRANYITAT